MVFVSLHVGLTATLVNSDLTRERVPGTSRHRLFAATGNKSGCLLAKAAWRRHEIRGTTGTDIYKKVPLPEKPERRLSREGLSILDARIKNSILYGLGPSFFRWAFHIAAVYDTLLQIGGFDGLANDDVQTKLIEYGDAEVWLAELQQMYDDRPVGASKADVLTRTFAVVFDNWMSFHGESVPKVQWRAGRSEVGWANNLTSNPFDIERQGLPENMSSRLTPDAAEASPTYLRAFLANLGFNDQDAVALIAFHGSGSAKSAIVDPENDGYQACWQDCASNTKHLTTQYFTDMLDKQWHSGYPTSVRDESRAFDCYTDEDSNLIRLPADLALVKDAKYLKYVNKYIEDEAHFLRDAVGSFSKLLEVGVPQEQLYTPC